MYKAGIIGPGNIAARYAKPSDSYPYCHTGGIRFCDATELVAVADLSEERREEFKQTWGPAFPLPHCTRNDYMAVNEIGFAMIESGLTGRTVSISC